MATPSPGSDELADEKSRDQAADELQPEPLADTAVTPEEQHLEEQQPGEQQLEGRQPEEQGPVAPQPDEQPAADSAPSTATDVVAATDENTATDVGAPTDVSAATDIPVDQTAKTQLANEPAGAEPTSESTPETTSESSPEPGRKGRRRQILIGSIVLACGSVAAAIPFFKASSPDSGAHAEPTDEERFAELLKTLQSSPDTVVRCDALTIQDSSLRALCDITRLTSLRVKVSAVTPATAAKLAEMPHLEELHLRGAPIDDELLKAIARSASLRVLNLPSCVVSPEAIESLRAMPQLRSLRLGIAQGTNQHARAVATLSRLRSVHLIGVAVTDEGLQSLAEMRLLESLYLDDSAVTEAGWLWLFEHYPELHVHINQLHHDRDPQKH